MISNDREVTTTLRVKTVSKSNWTAERYQGIQLILQEMDMGGDARNEEFLNQESFRAMHLKALDSFSLTLYSLGST